MKFSPLAPRRPNRRGSRSRCLCPLPPSVSVCLLVPSICSPRCPSCEVVISEVGEVFSFPLYIFILAPLPKSFFYPPSYSSNCVCVCKNRMPVTNTPPPPSQMTSVAIIIKSCTMNGQTMASLQLCGINDAFRLSTYISFECFSITGMLAFATFNRVK